MSTKQITIPVTDDIYEILVDIQENLWKANGKKPALSVILLDLCKKSIQAFMNSDDSINSAQISENNVQENTNSTQNSDDSAQNLEGMNEFLHNYSKKNEMENPETTSNSFYSKERKDEIHKMFEVLERKERFIEDKRENLEDDLEDFYQKRKDFLVEKEEFLTKAIQITNMEVKIDAKQNELDMLHKQIAEQTQVKILLKKEMKQISEIQSDIKIIQELLSKKKNFSEKIVQWMPVAATGIITWLMNQDKDSPLRKRLMELIETFPEKDKAKWREWFNL